jgi:integrase
MPKFERKATKLTLDDLRNLKPGERRTDPRASGAGFALCYRQKERALHAELRFRNPPGVTPLWTSKSLGMVDIAARLRDLRAEWEERQARSRRLSPNWRHLSDRPARPFRPTLDAVVEHVRKRADEERRKLQAGEDPRGGAFTLRAALELHLTGKQRSPRTEQEYRDRVRLHLGDWLDLPLARLDRAAVRERHWQITTASGPYVANNAMRVLRAVWNRARRQHPELPGAPTANVDFHPEERRDAAIPLALLPQWWRDIHAHPDHVRRDFYLLSLFTGLRRHTVETIRVEHIDLAARTLRIPNPKGGAKRAFTLPLSTYLVELIEARILLNGGGVWLFPGNTTSGHLTNPHYNNGGYKGVPFTVHGLRNSYISAAEAAGVGSTHIKLLVNHSVPKADVTGGYVSRDVDGLREPQQRVTDWLLKAVGA